MPEGFFPLAEATLYLAIAPKTNTVGAAYGRALEDAQRRSPSRCRCTCATRPRR